MKTRTILLLLLACVLFCFGLRETIDFDMWWHLKVGELVLKQGIPRADTFSFTVPGRPFIDQEWLSELFMYLVNVWAGLPGLMIAFAVLAVLAFGFVYLTCGGLMLVAIPLTVLGCYASQFLWKARPQILNIFMLAVFLWMIQSVRNGKRSWRWLYVLPLLLLLWVNMHSGSLLGLVVLFVVLVCDAFQVFCLRSSEGGLLRPPAIGHFLAVFLLSAVGSLLNPVGHRIFFFPIHTMGTPLFQSAIMEWKSHDFHNPLSWGFLGLLGVGMMGLLLFPRRTNLANAALYAGAMAAGLMSRRHSPFFSVVAVPLITQMISDKVASATWRSFLGGVFGWDRLKRIRFVVMPFLAGLMLFGVFRWSEARIVGNDRAIEKVFPVKAVEFLERKGFSAMKVFNEYAWGGYLIWSGFPVFIDGRTEVYGSDFFLEYLKMVDARWWSPQIAGFFKRWGIEYCLISARCPLRGALKMSGEWQEVYQDGLASIFIRRSSSIPLERSSGKVSS